jgi:hypothetical protein
MRNDWDRLTEFVPAGYQPLEVTLKHPDDFLKVRETLTRIGVASKKDATLYQSCHILHKRGRYYLVHFLELFGLDGKLTAPISENDIQRRNLVASLLAEWGLVERVDPVAFLDMAPLSQVKVISYNEKGDLVLRSKYTIGRK